MVTNPQLITDFKNLDVEFDIFFVKKMLEDIDNLKIYFDKMCQLINN